MTCSLPIKVRHSRISFRSRHQRPGAFYYGYRYYDPQTGRWPSRDPLGECGFMLRFYEKNEGSLTKDSSDLKDNAMGNIYTFCENSPVIRHDYIGLICCYLKWSEHVRGPYRALTTSGTSYRYYCDRIERSKEMAGNTCTGVMTYARGYKIYATIVTSFDPVVLRMVTMAKCPGKEDLDFGKY